MSKKLILITFLLSLVGQNTVLASDTMDDSQIKNVNRAKVNDPKEAEMISTAAGYLSDYEFAAKKLIDSLNQKDVDSSMINQQATALMALSETVLESARFRLPQCTVYLDRTMELKDQLNTISHNALEKDYHHDGVLPNAPDECYHVKDLFVHPATVLVLMRGDPALAETTRAAINAEITEVLAHTELVRRLVIY